MTGPMGVHRDMGWCFQAGALVVLLLKETSHRWSLPAWWCYGSILSFYRQGEWPWQCSRVAAPSTCCTCTSIAHPSWVELHMHLWMWAWGAPSPCTHQPCSLKYSQASDVSAWHRLGLWKGCCCKFEAPRHAHLAQQHASTPLDMPTCAIDIHTMQPDSCHLPKHADTLPGLQEHVWNVPGLVDIATSPTDVTQPGPMYPHTIWLWELDMFGWVFGWNTDQDSAFICATEHHAAALVRKNPGGGGQIMPNCLVYLVSHPPGSLDVI